MDSLCLEAVSFDASELVTRYLYKHPFELLLNIRLLINPLTQARGIFRPFNIKTFTAAAKIAGSVSFLRMFTAHMLMQLVLLCVVVKSFTHLNP